MAQLKSFCKKIILSIIMISIIISSCAVPNSYAKLALQDGEFYYAGTTKGSYVPKEGIFTWMIDALSKIASFLLALIPNVLRMAFVGYAALAEKLLTWAVESTAGVNLEGEDVNATDLSALSDSTNNVTVQAIVYNMVPALNVNFFDVSEDKKDLYIKEIRERDADGNLKTKEVVISPTGQQLICKKCKESVLKCCKELDDSKKEIKCYGTGGKNDCGCNGCEACKKYVQLMIATDPIIVQLKTLIAVWYYLIRLLAVAAMAVVLVAIGIKMAISTIASDKAVYKRMLVDWVAGVILIFTMHYIMYFAITINEILVNTVRESANAINKVQLAQLAETKNGSGKDADKEVEKSNQDIEIDVYEEIRTRAYDMKMTVGLMGMIMYFAMVFMAFKYTLIYLKRFLTLAVLTLMAPGLGVSYALQKVLSGKSSSLKTWLTEYLLNLLIQVVHALIYAIFISAALAYSLENVSGVILALILMNFSLKAEGIFRRIFNLDPGNKGLLGSTETAGDKDKLMKNAKTMKGLAMGAKPVAKALTKAPAFVAGTTGKGAAALGLLGGVGAKKLANYISEKPKVQKGKQAVSNAVSNKVGSIKRGEGVSGKAYLAGKTIAKPITVAGRFVAKHMPKTQRQEDKELLRLGQAELEKKLKEAKSEYAKDTGNVEKGREALEANRRLERYRKLTAREAGDLTVKDVAVGHVKALFDVNNYFDVKFSADGKKSYKMKSGLIFGTRKYNAETGKFEKDNSNAAYTQLGASKLLGFTDQDKKIFKEQIMNPAVKGFGGMAAMFMGLGTFTGHPVVGMGLLAGGMGTTTGMLKKFKQPKEDAPGRLRCIHRVKGKILPTRRYKFGSFTAPTVAKMRDELLLQANRELSKQLTSGIEDRHPGFSERIRNDLISAKTLIPAIGGGIAFGTISLPAGILAATLIKKKIAPARKQDPRNGKYININDPYQLEEDKSQLRLHPAGQTALDVVDAHHFQQLKDQMKKFNDESGDVMNKTILSNGSIAQRSIMNKFNQNLDSLSSEEADKMAKDIYALAGFDFDPKTGVKTSKTNDLDVNKRDIVKDIEITDKTGKTTKKEITDADIKQINKALNDAILARVTEKAGRAEELDINDESILFDIIDEVSNKPEIKQLLSSDQGVEVLFKGNMSALKSTIKDKATSANNFAKNEIAKNLQLNGEEFDVLKESIMEVAQESASKDGRVDMSTLDQEKIFSKIQDKMNLTQPDQTVQQDKKTSKKDKVNNNVDQLLLKSKETTYKKAISTLLTSDSPKGLNVNVKSENAKNKINSILNLQTGSDPLQIRDRITTDSVSKSVSFEKKPTKEQLKKKAKKSVIEILDACAGNVESSSKPEGEMTPIENIARAKSKEKFKQAKAATEGLESILGSTIVDSLFAMSNTQDELKELNVYAHENFSQTSKFKKGKKYLQAVMDLSDARNEVNRIEMTEKVTGKKDPKRKQRANLNKLLAEEKIKTVGPVVDTVEATNYIIAEMKKRM